MASKLQTFEKKQTQWLGLWYHPEYGGFSSQALNLSVLKEFKGNVRLYIRKNKYFNGGENGRPNYNFCIKDAGAEVFTDIEVLEDDESERLYTHDEVQHAINCTVIDARNGYTDLIVEDYL